MAMIKNLVSEKPLVIFSKSECGISYSIKTVISGFGANPCVYELDKLPNGQHVERELQVLMGRKPCVPAVFIGEEFVGGSNEIMSLLLRGNLGQLLKDAKAIWL